VATLISALLDNLAGRELVLEKKKEKTATKLDAFIDYIIPRPTSTVRKDVELSQFPM